MRGQTVAQAIAVVLMSGILAACSGGGPTIGNGSGSGGGSSSSSSSSSGSGSSSGSVTGQVAAHIILVSSSPTLAANAGTAASGVTVTATVTDANNVSIPGYSVSFSSNAGVLTPAALVTDANGNIAASLLAGSSAPGAVITVSATASPLAAVSVSVTVASTTPSYALGNLSATGTFTSGVIAIGQTPLSAGGSSGLQVAIVDTANGNVPYTGSATVSFSSPCESQNLAVITSPITSASGTFSTTYNAEGCNGSDVITASAAVNGATLSATGTINVKPATLGAVVFDSATPTSIGLQGTGLTDSSIIVFTVVDSNGNPVQNQQVDFSLTTTAGGLSVSPANAKSNASGMVQTTVLSGSVHTTVRVIAVIDGTSLTTESSQLTVSTGVPTQNGFSLSTGNFNLIGDDFDGNTTSVTARLADRYGNPVPDGTSVAFTTECGSIQPSCTTSDGACSVTFTTQNPRTRDLSFAASGSSPASPTYTANSCAGTTSSAATALGFSNIGLGCDDHRCTVTAYAIGEESFTDCNGTGNYVSMQNTSNNATQCPDGDFFVSLPEVFFDYNESGIYNPAFETYVDYNHNGKYDYASGLFVGLLCNDPECDPNQNELNVSGDVVIIMSSEKYNIFASTENPNVASPIDPANFGPPSCGGCNVSSLSLALGTAETVWVSVGDDALQNPATGATIAATMSNGGSVLSPSSFVVPNTEHFGYITYPVTIVAPTTSTTLSDTFIVNATSPAFGTNAGLVTTLEIPVSYTTATAAPSPSSLAFGDVAVNTSSSTKTVTITNSSAVQLKISSVSLAGFNSSEFAIVSNNCDSVAIGAGGSCSVGVTFDPTATGSADAVLSVSSNAANSPLNVPLSGTGD